MKAVGDAADLRRTSLRLGLQAGLLVVGCLLAVGALLFAVYERAAADAADQLLRDATTKIDVASEAPPGVRVVVVTPQGRSLSTGMPEGLPDEEQIAATTRDGQTRETDVVRGHDTYTIRTAAVDGRVTQAVLDRHEADEERGRILTALLTAGVLGVLLAALVAAWLARRTVRPMANTIAMQRRFVADASHELRTPLTLLSTRAQLLARRLRRDPQVTDQVVADVDGVVADTRTLTEILDDLLTAADTRGNAHWESLDARELVEEVVGAAAAAAEKSGITLRTGQRSGAVMVEGSPPSLRRALTALVDNAVDHAATEVTISAYKRGRRVDIEVRDDGPGILTDLAPRLFDRFTGLRSESPSVDGRRHYGLGLALVADVAANHHGRIAVAHRQDGQHGAVFTLTLPVHRAARP
jgi:two-component system OmpR family sensor kinase